MFILDAMTIKDTLTYVSQLQTRAGEHINIIHQIQTSGKDVVSGGKTYKKAHIAELQAAVKDDEINAEMFTGFSKLLAKLRQLINSLFN